MQRTWRPGRVILAGLFLALAVAAYAFWPAMVRWRVEEPYQSIIGYSPARKQLLTTINPFMDADGNERGRTFTNASDSIGIYGFDLVSGRKSFVQTIECPSKPDTLMIVSPDGQKLVVADEDVRLFNIETGQQQLKVVTTGEQAAVVFSADNERMAVVTWKQIQVWDLVKREMIFRVPFFLTAEQLVLSDVYYRRRGNFENRPRCDTTTFSHDHRYLAISLYGQLICYDVTAAKPLAQKKDSSVPRFLSNGKLGLLGTFPQPWKFVVQQLDLQLQDTEVPRRPLTAEKNRKLMTALKKFQYVYSEYLHIGQKSCLFAEEATRYTNWPDWVPKNFSSMIDDWYKSGAEKWIVSYCDLDSGKLVKRLVVPGDPFCKDETSESTKMRTLRRSKGVGNQVPFDAIPVQDHTWVVLYGGSSVELWPLLTYWRPWYCWVTVAGLVLIAVYCVWHCRRSAISR